MESEGTSRDVVKLELAEEVLRSSGELRFVARGGSMIPAIFPGDILLVRQNPIDAMVCSQVALWRRHGRFYAHRVVGIVSTKEQKGIVTQGDALRDQDQKVTSEEFLGRVYAIVRREKRIDLTRPQSLRSRAIAFLARHSGFVAKWLLRYNSLMWQLAGREHPLAVKERCELLECA
jgi:signal peptidase I